MNDEAPGSPTPWSLRGETHFGDSGPWVRSIHATTSTIIGATSLDQLTSAAQATEVAISEDEAKILEEPYQFRVPPPA